MAGVINKEQRPELKETVETNLPERQPELTASSIPPTLYKSDFEVELVSTTPPPPPRSLGSPWIISIREKLEQARQYEASSSWATQSIYRVPKALREIDETAYTPQIVSLGPYHRGRLPDMDCHKWRALNHALDRTGHNLCDYLDAARSLEDRARACYEAPLSISSDDFVESLVLDSIFTLELFRKFVSGDDLGYNTKDPIFGDYGVCTTLSLHRDMILLENQLPLFVLDRILALQLGLENPSGLVADFAFHFFQTYCVTDEPLPSAYSLHNISNACSSEARHCLDVFRRSLLLAGPRPASQPQHKQQSQHIDCAAAVHYDDAPERAAFEPTARFPTIGPQPKQQFIRTCLIREGPQPASQPQPKQQFIRTCLIREDPQPKQQSRLIHCVAELRDAGIKFRRRKSKPLWDIKFKGGVLHIPRLLITDQTKFVFRNLIAFEQCHLESGSRHITSYVMFMDSLINSEMDVRYLHYKGIIENLLGSDGEVANLFNGLCQEVAFNFDNCYLSEQSERVNSYYDKRWNTWRASLNHKYFNNPWSIISFIAGVVLLLLTFAQTFYAIYSYHKPHN